MEKTIIPRSAIQKILELSVGDLRRYDHELLKSKEGKGRLGEWAIAHRLAVYIEHHFYKEFGQYREILSVDCEYNKQRFDMKGYLAPTVNGKKQFRPDIIIHQRREKNNVLVIEIKKDATEWEAEKDKAKLRILKRESGGYEYSHALFINFIGESEITYEYIDEDSQDASNIRHF